MDANMSQNTKQEVLEKLRRRYAAAGLEHRRKLIDQAVELMGYHRKSAIRALRPKAAPVKRRKLKATIGRPRLYEPGRLLPVLKRSWLAGQQPCGRRLESMMPEWVPAYEAYHRRVANSVREQLLEASSATLDRLLHSVRVRAGKSRGTRPGTMLRQEIPIRGGAWQSTEAGSMEADTVSLCGGNANGEVVHVLDNTDICTTWVEMRAMYGRGQLVLLCYVESEKTSSNFRPQQWQKPIHRSNHGRIRLSVCSHVTPEVFFGAQVDDCDEQIRQDGQDQVVMKPAPTAPLEVIQAQIGLSPLEILFDVPAGTAQA